jgi:molecular chaperone DnaK (HSP70)
MSSDKVFIVGIDLGTTNSAVSYVRTDVAEGQPQEILLFEIPQLTAPGTVEPRPLLPSALLLPGPSEVAAGALSLPWKSDASFSVGEFARSRGAELSYRLITSAKSWLCNTMVDRDNPILPWQGPEDAEKISPVTASARILEHIRDAWNYAVAGTDRTLRLERQEILLTVPASFDAAARELTAKAAATAGFENLTLIEEPTAAFYAWIEKNKEEWRRQVRPGDVVLVCDVGGGTSDFSLIEVSEEDGNLTLQRVAVGNHLLVGGDNMDLALAHIVARKLSEKGAPMDAWQMRSLWHSCRQAKERLFEDDRLASRPITVLGRGTRLIGATLKSEITREDLDSVLLDGFFPFCEPDARPVTPPVAGIREIGLAYEADPAVTRHLAYFLHRHTSDNSKRPAYPTAVLFNGGVMKAAAIRKRVMDLLSEWRGGAGKKVREIVAGSFELAVARGASYYGLARRGRGVRIRAGLERSYYVGIAASMPAVPGFASPTKALCVAPFGMEEGESVDLTQREYALVTGEPAKFDLLSSTDRPDDRPGDVVEDWQDAIRPVAALETVLQGEAGRTVPVTLEVHVTEIGTMEVWCVAKEGGQRWKLEFNVREQQ